MLETRAKQEPTIKLTANEQVAHARKTSMPQAQQDKLRRPQQDRKAPTRYEDYKLYIMATEEDNFLFTTLDKEVATKPEVIDDTALEAVAHFIMMHYDELGRQRNKKEI